MNQSLINKYTGEVLQIVSGGADSDLKFTKILCGQKALMKLKRL